MSIKHYQPDTSHADCVCSRRAAIRSFVAGSLLAPGIVHELLAADSARDDADRSASHDVAEVVHVVVQSRHRDVRGEGVGAGARWYAA